MRIVHRISISADAEIRMELATMGIKVNEGFVAFDVDESHDAWPSIREWIPKRGAVDVVTTKFAKTEILKAAWLALLPSWHYGYPQPNEDEFGYLEATYDLTNYCSSCGVGLRQIAPFQMKSEPRWGKRSILQLNWIFDEYFVTPAAWETVFHPFGMSCRSVLGPKGEELNTVVQLVIPGEADMEMKGLPAETCSVCGREKYLPITKGFYPALATQPSEDMFKTIQYFGSGAAAHRSVIVSQNLAARFVSENVNGASLWPLE